MLNWKLEDYKVGDKVCVINKIGLYNTRDIIIEGNVIHSGTKILKVVIPFGEAKKKTLIFNGRRSCSGASFGDYYLVYKTLEEYKQTVLERENIEKLKTYITRSVNDLPLEVLKDITDRIDAYKTKLMET